MPTAHGHALLWLPGWRNRHGGLRESMQSQARPSSPEPAVLHLPASKGLLPSARLTPSPDQKLQPLLRGRLPLPKGRTQGLL